MQKLSVNKERKLQIHQFYQLLDNDISMVVGKNESRNELHRTKYLKILPIFLLSCPQQQGRKNRAIDLRKF